MGILPPKNRRVRRRTPSLKKIIIITSLQSYVILEIFISSETITWTFKGRPEIYVCLFYQIKMSCFVIVCPEGEFATLAFAFC